MLVRKDLLNNFGEAIGEYFISTKDEVKVTLNGKTVVEKDLAPDDQNSLARYADAFEDGFNRVENGKELYEVAGFRFSRPAYNIKRGDTKMKLRQIITLRGWQDGSGWNWTQRHADDIIMLDAIPEEMDWGWWEIEEAKIDESNDTKITLQLFDECADVDKDEPLATYSVWESALI